VSARVRVREQDIQLSIPHINDFNFLAVIGKGDYGKVMLAEHKETCQLYAIKTKKKKLIEDSDEQESISVEKKVSLIAKKDRHPFLVNLYACFQTEKRFYSVMEYIAGGDLMFHIQKGPLRPEQIRCLPV
jgi:serine/threonine protein kinase